MQYNLSALKCDILCEDAHKRECGGNEPSMCCVVNMECIKPRKGVQRIHVQDLLTHGNNKKQIIFRILFDPTKYEH